MNLTPDATTALFTRTDGNFGFARWDRPLVPIVFGVTDETLPVIKGAIEAVVAIAGHRIEETDPELGANFMVFFLADWAELADVPHLGDLIPDLPGVVTRLQGAGATQYRAFRFDDGGAIKACFTFVRLEGAVAALPAEVIALSLAVQGILLWSDRAFADASPLAEVPGGGVVVRPDIANLIRAAYDPLLPHAARDASHALRLFARATKDRP